MNQHSLSAEDRRELIEVRRDLHQHPELAFEEERTAAMVADKLKGWGYEVTMGVARTGVVAMTPEADGPTVLLRADMDALPIHELSETSYRSDTDGLMHACGHDAFRAQAPDRDHAGDGHDQQRGDQAGG